MSRSAPRALTFVAVLAMVASVIGFIVSLVLNAFVFDEYDAYGEVPIPGSGSVQLPQGEVLVSFHTIVIGSTGSGLPVPSMSISVAPPEGVADPVLTEDIGGTTTVNNDARVRVWVLQVPAEGTYDITTEGNVGAYLNPSLAFGRGSQYGWLPWVFVGIFGLGIVDLIVARVWAARVRKRDRPVIGFYGTSTPYAGPTTWAAGSVPTYGGGPPAAPFPPPTAAEPHAAYVPTDQGVRIEQLNTLARLRDSGALTQDEFEAEKKRILEGD